MLAFCCNKRPDTKLKEEKRFQPTVDQLHCFWARSEARSRWQNPDTHSRSHRAEREASARETGVRDRMYPSKPHPPWPSSNGTLPPDKPIEPWNHQWIDSLMKLETPGPSHILKSSELVTKSSTQWPFGGRFSNNSNNRYYTVPSVGSENDSQPLTGGIINQPCLLFYIYIFLFCFSVCFFWWS